jgi:RNA polymerase sigma-70 factor (ECF subfamily)
MSDKDQLAAAFEANRARLRGIAYRMLGSAAEAEDAVQEAWLRVQRSDMGAIENIGGWLTTVVARICLDMLDPDVVFRADSAAMHGKRAQEVRGAAAVSKMYKGRAQGAGLALLDGRPGTVVTPRRASSCC